MDASEFFIVMSMGLLIGFCVGMPSGWIVRALLDGQQFNGRARAARAVGGDTIADSPLVGMTVGEAERFVDLHELRRRRLAGGKR